jgi:hypothetical protein
MKLRLSRAPARRLTVFPFNLSRPRLLRAWLSYCSWYHLPSASADQNSSGSRLALAPVPPVAAWLLLWPLGSYGCYRGCSCGWVGPRRARHATPVAARRQAAHDATAADAATDAAGSIPLGHPGTPARCVRLTRLVTDLEYAAEQGVPGAIWKLAACMRMGWRQDEQGARLRLFPPPHHDACG